MLLLHSLHNQFLLASLYVFRVQFCVWCPRMLAIWVVSRAVSMLMMRHGGRAAKSLTAGKICVFRTVETGPEMKHMSL